jgi:MFS family permease
MAELRARTDEFVAGPRDPDADEQPQSRRGRSLLWWDGLVSSISESFITNFVNPFALALTATNTQIGWLSSLSNLASALALFPGARLVERTGHRKRIVVLTSGGAARLLLLAIALVPALFHGQAAIYAFIALIALRAFFSQFGYPAWSSLVADLVPASIRGRYFASRNIALAIAALIFTPLAGKLAASLGLPQGYQVGFFVAGLIGFLATAIFSRIPEPPQAPLATAAKGQQEGVWSILRHHPKFAGFTAVAFLWNLALMVAGPFFSVYLVRDLGASPFLIGLLAAAFSLANIVGQRVWGRLNDRRGAVWVMRVTGFMIPAIPLLWSMVPNPWYLLAVESFSGFTWAGYSLANFNLLLGLAPPAQRARFTAIYQVAVFGAACVGPLVGSVLANAFSIRPLFWISAAGRLVASVLFLFTVREDHG